MHGLKTELNVWLLETQISHSSQISCVSCHHCTIKYTVKLCSFNCFQTTFIVNKAALKHYIKICCILVSIKRTMNLRLTWSSHWDLHLSKLLSNYLEQITPTVLLCSAKKVLRSLTAFMLLSHFHNSPLLVFSCTVHLNLFPLATCWAKNFSKSCKTYQMLSVAITGFQSKTHLATINTTTVSGASL